MSSGEYQYLEHRLVELRAQFVDFEIPLDREPNSDELSNIAAFKLLIHAEVQTYIEDRIIRAINESVDEWCNKKQMSRCVLNLLLGWSDASGGAEKYPTVHDISGLNRTIKMCANRVIREISDNNGIKREAFLWLSFAAGIFSDEIDSTLLNELQSFGKARGDVAHKSIGKVRTLYAPNIEAESAQNIVNLLGHFDNNLDSIDPKHPNVT